MSANERRNELMRILTMRRRENVSRLAVELGVSERTILRDIEALTAEYPIETVRGNGGGVCLADWYSPGRHLLTNSQQKTLNELLEMADEQQKQDIYEILRVYGDPKQRDMYP